MKNFLTIALVLIPLCFISCNDDMAIDHKSVTAADFLELYGQDADALRLSLKKYKIDEEGIDQDGNTYWTISKSRSSVLIPCDEYEVFVSFTMVGNKCVEVSLLYQDTYWSGSALRGITEKFGEGTKIDYDSSYWWYEWHLSDNSRISCFGQKYKDSLLIYREKEGANNAPAKQLQRVKKMAGIEE